MDLLCNSCKEIFKDIGETKECFDCHSKDISLYYPPGMYKIVDIGFCDTSFLYKEQLIGEIIILKEKMLINGCSFFGHGRVSNIYVHKLRDILGNANIDNFFYQIRLIKHKA